MGRIHANGAHKFYMRDFAYLIYSLARDLGEIKNGNPALGLSPPYPDDGVPVTPCRPPTLPLGFGISPGGYEWAGFWHEKHTYLRGTPGHGWSENVYLPTLYH